MIISEYPDYEREGHDAAAAGQGVAAHIAAVGVTPPSPFGNSFGSMPSTQQYSFVDPSVMMMTNAAATIAAVAASAVQQIAQAKNASNTGGGSTSPVPPALVAALRNAGKPIMPSHASHTLQSNTLPPQIAALLGVVGGGQPSMQFQNPAVANAGSVASLHQALSPVEPTPGLRQSAAAQVAMASALLPSMQNWNKDQLEHHSSMFQQLNQPVPQSVALLLADAKRKLKKKTAKRAANRKSASTSRARKKALVEEMTKANARLRRQALILELLPDLVIATTTDGEITFCSSQVEKVLHHNSDDLIGAKLHSLLVPASKVAMIGLIEELVNADKKTSSAQARRGTKRRLADQRNNNDGATGRKNAEESGNSNLSGSSRSGANSGRNTSAAALVSELSFPLSVVEVASKQSRPSVAAAGSTERNETSDTSASKQQMSSVTNSARLSPSPTASSSGEDDRARGGSSRRSGRAARAADGKRLPSSDDSSSLSSDAKNMRNAHENLDRNVRWHNRRMMEDGSKNKSDYGPTDDVTGASVTANNATARLSSLIHVPEFAKPKEDISARYESTGDQSSSDDSLLAGVEEKKKRENASDDSGYRESNDSREETSSSGSDTSNSHDRTKKRLAPSCRVCLIREDLTTVWCEVTSSMRTRSPDEDTEEFDLDTSKSSISAVEAAPKPEYKEILLCLRPIHDGEKKADESLRFVAQKTTYESEESLPISGSGEGMVSSSSGDARNQEKPELAKSSSGSGESNSTSAAPSSQEQLKRLPKKRQLTCHGDDMSGGDDVAQSKQKRAKAGDASDTEKSVVESLMLMNQSSL